MRVVYFSTSWSYRNPTVVAVLSLCRVYTGDVVVFCDRVETIGYLRGRLPLDVKISLSPNQLIIGDEDACSKYARFEVLRILKEEYDQALYLDSDIFVQSSVDEMFDFTQNQIAVVLDQQYDNDYLHVLPSYNETKSKYCPMREYANSGVILFNLEQIDIDEMESVIIDMYENDPTIIDQDFMNKYFNKQYIDPKYNRTVEVYYAQQMSKDDVVAHYNSMLDAVIVHYILDTKPWKPIRMLEYDFLWKMVPLLPYILFIGQIHHLLEKWFVDACRENYDMLRKINVPRRARYSKRVLDLGGGK